MCNSRVRTSVLLIFINVVMSATEYSCNKSKSLDVDNGTIGMNISVPVYEYIKGSVNSELPLTSPKQRKDPLLQNDDKVVKLDAESGLTNTNSSVLEDGNVTDLWTDVSLDALNSENITTLCKKGLWIPVTMMSYGSSLQLEACLKFIIPNTALTKQNVGYVLNSSILTGIYQVDTVISDNQINSKIYFSSNQSYYSLPPLTLDIQIDKGDGNTYYWGKVILAGYIDNMYISDMKKGLRKYETKLRNSYSCQFADNIYLEDGVTLVIKDLKYRAFRTANRLLEDNDIQHCPSEFGIFLAIGAFICVLIVITLATVIWTCCKMKSNTGYSKFERRFEP